MHVTGALLKHRGSFGRGGFSEKAFGAQAVGALAVLRLPASGCTNGKFCVVLADRCVSSLTSRRVLSGLLVFFHGMQGYSESAGLLLHWYPFTTATQQAVNQHNQGTNDCVWGRPLRSQKQRIQFFVLHSSMVLRKKSSKLSTTLASKMNNCDGVLKITLFQEPYLERGHSDSQRAPHRESDFNISTKFVASQTVSLSSTPETRTGHQLILVTMSDTLFLWPETLRENTISSEPHVHSTSRTQIHCDNHMQPRRGSRTKHSFAPATENRTLLAHTSICSVSHKPKA